MNTTNSCADDCRLEKEHQEMTQRAVPSGCCTAVYNIAVYPTTTKPQETSTDGVERT